MSLLVVYRQSVTSQVSQPPLTLLILSKRAIAWQLQAYTQKCTQETRTFPSPWDWDWTAVCVMNIRIATWAPCVMCHNRWCEMVKISQWHMMLHFEILSSQYGNQWYSSAQRLKSFSPSLCNSSYDDYLILVTTTNNQSAQSKDFMSLMARKSEQNIGRYVCWERSRGWVKSCDIRRCAGVHRCSCAHIVMLSLSLTLSCGSWSNIASS